MQTLADRPYWELSFDDAGALTAPRRETFLGEVAGADLTDLIMVGHGWGTPEDGARDLYAHLVPLIARAADAETRLGTIGFCGILWPSIWFPDPPVGPQHPAGAALAAEPGTGGPVDAPLTGGRIAEELRASFPDPRRHDTVAELGRLIDDGLAAAAAGTEPAASQERRLTTFHELLQTLLPARAQPAFEDSGETALLRTADPQTDYAFLADHFGTAPPGPAAQGLGDLFGKVWNGAKDALRIASYFTMKARAGEIGRLGLGPLLEELHRRAATTRVHLVGHSFGARLVSFALAGTSSGATSPVGSLLLVQGAFSHWSFTGVRDNPFGQPGALHPFADRVHGPLVATFSDHDWAVGRWYPKASLLAQQDSSDAEAATRWGGMGAAGFQKVSPAQDRDLLPAGAGYGFQAGTFYRVDGSAVINDTAQSAFAGAHSDIRRPEVAWLAVSAAAAAAR